MQRCTIIQLFLLFAFLIASATPAQAAFHTGGVGACGGCHVGHASGGAGLKLLFASDPGSVCLTCHAGPGGASLPSIFSFDGAALTPGGDFYWLNKTFSWTGGTSPGQRHGHNVVAFDFGLVADPDKLTAPGGSYPAALLSCVSCHDPHGRSQAGTAEGGLPVSFSGSYGQLAAPMTTSGSYRMLAGAGYSNSGYTFSTDAPVARQNGARPFGESDSSHVDYGAGMSEWCGNCHSGILSGDHNTGGLFTHPSGSTSLLSSEMLATYNSYINSSDSSGTVDTAYLQFVPFERGITDVTLLDPTSRRGPVGNANVSCLTCHRAHASAFMYAGRWDFNAARLADSHPAIGDGGATATDVANSYYGRDTVAEFGAGQGPFCEKCHAGSPP